MKTEPAALNIRARIKRSVHLKIVLSLNPTFWIVLWVWVLQVIWVTEGLKHLTWPGGCKHQTQYSEGQRHWVNVGTAANTWIQLDGGVFCIFFKAVFGFPYLAPWSIRRCPFKYPMSPPHQVLGLIVGKVWRCLRPRRHYYPKTDLKSRSFKWAFPLILILILWTMNRSKPISVKNIFVGPASTVLIFLWDFDIWTLWTQSPPCHGW